MHRGVVCSALQLQLLQSLREFRRVYCQLISADPPRPERGNADHVLLLLMLC